MGRLVSMLPGKLKLSVIVGLSLFGTIVCIADYLSYHRGTYFCTNSGKQISYWQGGIDEGCILLCYSTAVAPNNKFAQYLNSGGTGRDLGVNQAGWWQNNNDEPTLVGGSSASRPFFASYFNDVTPNPCAGGCIHQSMPSCPLAGVVLRNTAVWVRLWPFYPVMFMIAAWLLLHRRKRAESGCVACGYELAGMARDRCPECGAAVRSRPT